MDANYTFSLPRHRKFVLGTSHIADYHRKLLTSNRRTYTMVEYIFHWNGFKTSFYSRKWVWNWFQDQMIA